MDAVSMRKGWLAIADIIGKKVYSRVYGEGVIINEEDGIITIDFLNKNKKVFVFRQRRLFVAIYRQSDLKTGF